MSQYNEPWHLGAYVVTDANHDTVFDVGGHEGFEPELAERIVACVNACRGIPTEALLKAGDESDEKTRLEIMAGELGYVVVDPHY